MAPVVMFTRWLRNDLSNLLTMCKLHILTNPADNSTRSKCDTFPLATSEYGYEESKIDTPVQHTHPAVSRGIDIAMLC
jgi:hypothetical protein